MLFVFIYVYWCIIRFPGQMMFVSLSSHTTCATYGAGTANTSGAHSQFLVDLCCSIFSFLCSVLQYWLSFYPFGLAIVLVVLLSIQFGHCIGCPFIHLVWPLYWLSFYPFGLAIVLVVLFRLAASNCPFGILKYFLFYTMFRFLVKVRSQLLVGVNGSQIGYNISTKVIEIKLI